MRAYSKYSLHALNTQVLLFSQGRLLRTSVCISVKEGPGIKPQYRDYPVLSTGPHCQQKYPFCNKNEHAWIIKAGQTELEDFETSFLRVST